MEPLKVVSTRGVNIDGEYVNESRVAAIYDTPHAPTWLVNIKELGQTWQVDYTDIDNLRIERSTTRSTCTTASSIRPAATSRSRPTRPTRWSSSTPKTRKLEAIIDTDLRPHPGPGANWIDPTCGPVGGTPHLGVGKMTVWGNDPAGNKDHAWKICYEVETDGPGLFIRTHPTSDYVWIDQTLHPEPEIQQSIKVIDKKTRESSRRSS
jgi:nitrite reductase (NO-forming) / hydroxylamine reductase